MGWSPPSLRRRTRLWCVALVVPSFGAAEVLSTSMAAPSPRKEDSRNKLLQTSLAMRLNHVGSQSSEDVAFDDDVSYDDSEGKCWIDSVDESTVEDQDYPSDRRRLPWLEPQQHDRYSHELLPVGAEAPPPRGLLGRVVVADFISSIVSFFLGIGLMRVVLHQCSRWFPAERVDDQVADGDRPGDAGGGEEGDPGLLRPT
eukprot:TRINITY_DN10724_c0_g1_i1.p1 TRINITY_DN10724_c0_g1~~TRINITY_DN10724_c0_g1_i1.p1  ORF type:complete len:200 (-),score=28.45 TRINITY_DN10724_c0_g1_i1:78-677(-)